MADTPVNLHALALVAIQDATQRLADGGSVQAWQRAMEQILARAHTAASIAGIAERAGVPPNDKLFRGLSRAERADIKAAVAAQLEYLSGFVDAVKAGQLSPAQIAARAALYAGATRQTYYAQRWGDWEIPDELLPGNQTCMANCKCRISVSDDGDGTGTLTREMGGTELHCDECPQLVGSYDVQRRRIAA